MDSYGGRHAGTTQSGKTKTEINDDANKSRAIVTKKEAAYAASAQNCLLLLTSISFE
ncbi:MAG: hypothetical protein P8M72_07170 [Gammaproteobacteria bacterium]|nr:hypothetical protein [Gammaproteobacteria bacterium]